MKKGAISKKHLIATGAVILILVLGYGIYYFWSLSKSLKMEISELIETLRAKEEELALVQKENSDLREALTNEQNKNQIFELQIQDIYSVVGGLSGTVGVLDKLSKTDPELLKKYSKVYFLSEHYVPELLTIVDSRYIYDKDRPQQIHVKVTPYLNSLLSAAEVDGIDLRVVSAYRSFGTQAAVKTGYTVVYGAGTANQFSAEQGYSEHQLGSTVDFTPADIDGSPFLGLEKTEAYKWLQDNAYKYGFILSYPLSNDYYQFEPWHWRFVGKKLAAKLYNENKYFYELSQRDIDEYLVNLFD